LEIPSEKKLKSFSNALKTTRQISAPPSAYGNCRKVGLEGLKDGFCKGKFNFNPA